jgi:low temperature requirement protein LtrA
MATTVRTTEAQGATFVELFFDLVFVFAVTQVTVALRDNLTAGGLVRAVVVFWLICGRGPSSPGRSTPPTPSIRASAS